jgi:hypothetical protein
MPAWVSCGESAASLADPPSKSHHEANSLDAGLPVEVGIPDSKVTTQFAPLSRDGDVTIRDGGQGGTHAMIAIRFEGFGNWVYYRVAISDLDGDSEVSTVVPLRPQPAPCDENNPELCRKSPIFVVLGGLAEREAWDGLHVLITAEVSNEDGMAGSATQRAYLRR